MSKRIVLHCALGQAEASSAKLANALNRGHWVQLQGRVVEQQVLIPGPLLPAGPGVVMASGGSTGGHKHCLLPIGHLDQSAEATSVWLSKQGISSKECLVLNPLPLHHVSGLMPWWRSRCWGAKYVWLEPALMRDPIELEMWSHSCSGWADQPVVVSLVPTQLKRLLAHPAGVRWLQGIAVIWIGGAALPNAMAETARDAGLRLAPCYGSTETAAMVAALPPDAFLRAREGCGCPLSDVQLRLGGDGAIQVKTKRLAVGVWREQSPDRLQPLCDQEGWWQSGDIGELIDTSAGLSLNILGRRDGAIQSGGVTVFPEQLERRLEEQAARANLPLDAVLFLPIDDDEWGHRLVALVKPSCSGDARALLNSLRQLCADWSPSDRPRQWMLCADLISNQAGKWDRRYWYDYFLAKRMSE